MERAASLRSHAGQPSFPGGALDPEDGDPDGDGPLRAALREAEEETGLDPAGVQVFGVLPRALHPGERLRRHARAGLVARARARSAPSIPRETARVFTVPVADLTDPANRATAVHPQRSPGPGIPASNPPWSGDSRPG